MRGTGKLALPAQRARRDALHAIGRTRRLTPEERREADNLDHRAYMRAWRSAQRDAELLQRKRRQNNAATLR